MSDTGAAVSPLRDKFAADLLSDLSAASGAPKECFRLINLQAGSVIATVEVSAGMYPPPHMTCMYPPPGWQCQCQFRGQLRV
jgi:hypothetical protein